MAEFGQPKRTATSDANAGFVNPPATREADRSAQSQNVEAVSDIDGAVTRFGKSMGTAFQKVLATRASNINEQRELAASIRQGEGKAINTIDKEKKRSGWSEALFGQNIDYRAAQQRGVSNNIQQNYLEQANKIAEFAAEDPVTYKARLSQQLDKQLDQYPNDIETRRLITTHWSKASEKLVQAQTKEHFGFAAQQQRETSKKQVRATFDTFTTEAKNITSEEEAQEFADAGARFFSGSSQIKGSSDSAYRSMVKEEIEYSLAQGNIGVYNMAKANGYFQNYSKDEQQKLDTAVNKYDIKAKQGMGLTVSEAILASSEITGRDAGEQLADILAQADEAMEEHASRSSGTNKYNLGVTKAKNSLNNIVNKGIKTAAKKQAEAKRLGDVVEAQNLASGGDATTLASMPNITKTEMEAATAVRVNDLVSDITGTEDMGTAESIQAMLQDPIGVGSKVVSMWGGEEFDSGIVKVMGTSYINGFSNSAMVDENGQPTEAAKNAMQLMSQFEAKDRAKFRAQLGNKAYDEYLIVKRGQSAGKPSDMINRDIVAAEEAKGKQNYYAADWSEVGVGGGEDGMTKREFITKKVKDITGQAPVGTDVGKYLRIYGEGVEAGKGDHDVGYDALYDAVKNKGAMYNGQSIENVDKVNAMLTDYTLPQLLEGIQRPDVNVMTGLLAVGMGMTEDENGVPIQNIYDKSIAGSVKFEVAHDGGLWMKSPKFQSDVYTSPERMQTFERVLKQQNNDNKLADEIREQSFILSANKSIAARSRTAR